MMRQKQKIEMRELMDQLWIESERDPKRAIFKRLWNELIQNDERRGGRLALITGEQGSGKTTLMLRIMEELHKQGTIIIWRGRNVEQIHRIPQWKERVVFHFHSMDDPKIYDVRGSVKIPVRDVAVKFYDNPVDLFEFLEDDRINVVFEPSVFYFTEELKLLDVVRRDTGLKMSERIKQEPQPSQFFWHEIVYLLTRKMNTYWYGLFIDEVDDVFPENPRKLQWRLQEWAKDAIKDFRKKRVSLIASTHNLSDVDHRVRGKFQFFIYMKNAKVSDKSLVDQRFVLNLATGVFIIENGLFGFGKVQPYPEPEMGDLMIVTERLPEPEGYEEV